MEEDNSPNIDSTHTSGIYHNNPNELQYITTDDSSLAVMNMSTIESNPLTMNTGSSLNCNTPTSYMRIPEEFTANTMSSAVTTTDPWMNQSHTTSHFWATPVNALSNTHDGSANVIAVPPISYILHDSAPTNTHNVLTNDIVVPPVGYILPDHAYCNSQLSRNVSEFPFAWTPYQSDTHQEFQEDSQNTSSISIHEPLITSQIGHYPHCSQVVQALPTPYSIHNDFQNVLTGPNVSTYSGHSELLESSLNNMPASFRSVNQCAPSWQLNHYPACQIDTSSELQVKQDISKSDSPVNQEEFQTAQSSLQEPIDNESESNENYECENGDLGHQESNYTKGVQFERGEDSTELPKQSQLEMHPRSQKTKKPLQCDLCSRKFSCPSWLRRHMRSHTKIKPYKCDLCPKTFSYKNKLIPHRRIHTGEKPYQCDLCPKQFTDRCDFIIHRRIHTGEKPYQCELCTSKFAQRGQLKKHKRVHTGEKPYLCDLCPKKFADRSNFILHRRIHTGGKPYQCDLCPKKFLLQRSLESHKLNHTGEKPYECDICLKKFSYKKNVKSHKSRYHAAVKPH